MNDLETPYRLDSKQMTIPSQNLRLVMHMNQRIRNEKL